MFEAKRKDKLHSTDSALYDNKVKLDELSLFDPFEMTDLNGIKVLAHAQFEPYYKVVQSLKVTDDNGEFLENQTQTLKQDVVVAAKQDTYLELLYLPELPQQEAYIDLLEEKLLLHLVNLVLEVEIPTNQTLSRFEINNAEKAFKKMLQNA